MRRYIIAAIGVWLLCGGVAWATPLNIVADPGFENANSQWVVTPEAGGSDFTFSGGVYYAGSHSAGFRGLPGQFPGTGPYGDFVSQVLTTTPGQSYSIDFWIKVNNTAGVSTMSVNWDGNKVWGYGYVYTSGPPYTLFHNYEGTWAHVTVPSLVTGTGSNTILFAGSEYMGDGVFVDNVNVSAVAGVPEPSTLVLLAAGLAGLLCYAWRKRR